MKPDQTNRRVVLLLCFWLLATGTGFTLLVVYSNTPGTSRSAPLTWPADSGLRLLVDSPTLLMFAHPRCPCTRASLAELQRLEADVGGRIGGVVLFYEPEGARQEWRTGGLWASLENLSRFEGLADVGGRLARKFGAETSGHVVVYDITGRLVFRGGVTAARAHEGSNRGRDAIGHYVEHETVLEPESDTFGCAIFDEQHEVIP